MVFDKLRAFASKARFWTDGDNYATGHSPDAWDRRRRSALHRRDVIKSERGFKDRDPDAVAKQDVERVAEISPELRSQLQDRDAVLKPYDVSFLKDLARHPVVQAYIDTMAQDAATASWRLCQRDESTDVSENAVDDATRSLEHIHPEKSFRDIRELTARNMLTLGDAAWIKHYTSTGEFAEAVPIDSSRLFKQVNTHGLTDGYVQASLRQQRILEEEDKLDLEQVVWFEWSSRPGHVYGHGPVEKGTEIIALLEELNDKERKDLEEGMPPGIISAQDTEHGRLSDDQFDSIKENWKLNEGERHRAVVSRGEWDFTPIQPSYPELQVLDRNRYWVQVLGAIFKVNASYAGFDIENVNRATDESQAEAYAQRGFRVLLRQMEEAINRQLIWSDISEDLRFEFETERTTQEQREHAQYLQTLANAAQEWDRAGRDVRLRDETLEIEDGPVDAPDDAGGPPGGLFASEGENLAKELTKADETLEDAFGHIVWADEVTKAEPFWDDDESVPQRIIDAIEEAIFENGAIFDAIEDIDAADELKEFFAEKLTQPQGWSLESLSDGLQDRFGLDPDQADAVGRTESASILNNSRETVLREMDGETDREVKVKWIGPSDDRTTEACEFLKDQTDPQRGGTPVSMDQLIALERRAQREFFDGLDSFREHVIHPNERHTFTQVFDADSTVEASVKTDGDDIPELSETPRKREVEACFSQSLGAALVELDDTCDTRSEMLRQINQRLDANGVETDVSRSTFYQWLSEANIR